MWKIIQWAIFQSVLLTAGHVFLKLALEKMERLSFTWRCVGELVTNWWIAACGVSYIAASLIWVYMLKHFPFNVTYPVISISYVFGMFASVIIFHEHAPLTRWFGVALIIAGCYFVVK